MPSIDNMPGTMGSSRPSRDTDPRPASVAPFRLAMPPKAPPLGSALPAAGWAAGWIDLAVRPHRHAGHPQLVLGIDIKNVGLGIIGCRPASWCRPAGPAGSARRAARR